MKYQNMDEFIKKLENIQLSAHELKDESPDEEISANLEKILTTIYYTHLKCEKERNKNCNNCKHSVTHPIKIECLQTGVEFYKELPQACGSFEPEESDESQKQSYD